MVNLDVPNSAYYFTNSQGHADAYVMARKLRTADEYLLTAWVMTGPDTNITVNIPDLGEVTLNARDVGSVYLATPTTLILQDENGLYPSIEVDLTSRATVGSLFVR